MSESIAALLMQSPLHLDDLFSQFKSLDGEHLAFFAGKIYRLRGNVFKSVFYGFTPEVDEKRAKLGEMDKRCLW